jgi:cytoskeleton protein RodZ
VESLGARLKKEREQRKITLDEIAVSTKIGTRFLRALEEEHFDQLPGGIFNKGFVRAYARHLGIDEEQAIADYVAAMGASQPEKKLEEVEIPEGWAKEESHSAARIPWGKFAIALLIIALGIVIWGFRFREQQERPTASSAANRAATIPASTALPSRSGLKPGKAAESTAQVVPAGGQPVSSTASGEPAASPAANPPVSQTSQSPSPAPTPGAFQVLIKARENSWLTITADGKEIMRDLLVAPGEESVEARKEIVVKAGNVGGLDFSFNGKKVPVHGDSDEVKILTFDVNGLQPMPAKTPAEPGPRQ